MTRAQAFAVVIGLVSAIGLADCASDTRVSLTVFYLIPILFSVAWIGFVPALWTAMASVVVRTVGDFASLNTFSLPLWVWWNAASALLMYFFIVWIFSNLLSMHRRLEERVAESTVELLHASEGKRLLQEELLSASSRERTAMGQELHDDICQHLVGTTLAAKVLAKHLSAQCKHLVGDANEIIELIEAATAKTRQLARGLLLSAIDPQELTERLSELVDEGSRSGIPCKFIHSGQVTIEDPSVAAQIYRIAQEAIRNAVRHADATHVEVALLSDKDAVRLLVDDDGRGLVGPVPRAGMGLPIMSQRAAYIGASLTFLPLPGRGTRLICHLPRGSSG